MVDVTVVGTVETKTSVCVVVVGVYTTLVCVVVMKSVSTVYIERLVSLFHELYLKNENEADVLMRDVRDCCDAVLNSGTERLKWRAPGLN